MIALLDVYIARLDTSISLAVTKFYSEGLRKQKYCHPVRLWMDKVSSAGLKLSIPLTTNVLNLILIIFIIIIKSYILLFTVN